MSPTASQLAKPFAVGHPKMEKLLEIVLEHFKRFMRGRNLLRFLHVIFHLLSLKCTFKSIDNFISSDQGVSERDVMTRIMIFATFRDSVNEITELLNRHRPLVRAMSFIGQSTGRTTKGFTQKEQLKVLETFS